MTPEDDKIRAPELTGGYWVNHEGLRLFDLKGKVALIDFWDYTCVNCIRTLPYVTEWHRRYRDKGLVVIGVHAPEFSFAKDLAGVQDALGRFGIEYPVIMDNGYSIWQAYANRYWPAKYLVDKDGYIRGYHYGEGAYRETEEAIQQLLREVDPAAELPAPMEPVRDSDVPGAVCYRVTPELYLGYQRGRTGNPAGLVPKETHLYRYNGPIAENYFYLDGEWKADDEFLMKPWGEGESALTLRYTAKEVNLVMNRLLEKPGRLYLEQDGALLATDSAGGDVGFDESGRAFVEVQAPRMFALVNNPDIGSHELRLVTDTPGLAMYAFTFVSCVAAPG
jgi:thiol-disulfide isomerase/thioredoxin